MRPQLHKPLSAQSSKHADLSIYSHITKLDHERRERGFQVFISGANKERLKIRDLQQEALQTKKSQISTKATPTRKPKAPENTLGRRRFWHKSSEIKIKGSNGSDFALLNQKSTKPDGSILHDITPKIEFHPSSQKNSQLNLIRNRYKAYFHIDGYGFCCSKKASKPLTPAKYQINNASLIFNRSSSKHLRRIQDQNISHSTSPQLFDNEEQKSQYYSLLNKNQECVSTLREFLTPDYEYFQSAKEINTISDFAANEANCADSYNGVIYDVFYHKDQSISQSTRALLPTNNQNEIYGSISDNGNAKDALFNNEPCTNMEKNEDESFEESIFYQDERALVLLENQNNLDDNIEMAHLPPLGKALSPISKLVKSSHNHKEKGSHVAVQEYQFLSHHRDKILCNSSDLDVDTRGRSTLKLNLRYLQNEVDFKNVEQSTLDPLQSYVNDGTSDDNQTQECSSTSSSTSESYHTWTSGLEKVDSEFDITPKLHLVNRCALKDNERINKASMFPDRVERITRTQGTLLSARVKRLDIRKKICLSNILDKLEVADVTGSVDCDFCQYGLFSQRIS